MFMKVLKNSKGFRRRRAVGFDHAGGLDRFQLPVGVEIISNFSKFSWMQERNCPHSRWYTLSQLLRDEYAQKLSYNDRTNRSGNVNILWQFWAFCVEANNLVGHNFLIRAQTKSVARPFHCHYVTWLDRLDPSNIRAKELLKLRSHFGTLPIFCGRTQTSVILTSTDAFTFNIVAISTAMQPGFGSCLFRINCTS